LEIHLLVWICVQIRVLRGAGLPARVAGTRTAFRAGAGGCGLNFFRDGSESRLAPVLGGRGLRKSLCGLLSVEPKQISSKIAKTWMYSTKFLPALRLGQ